MTQYVPLTREQFRARFFERFYDPAFDDVRAELEKVCERAWDGYIQYRKSPRTQPAGEEFSDPAFKLPLEWLATRKAIREAEKKQKDPASPSRVLVVSGATRSEASIPVPAKCPRPGGLPTTRAKGSRRTPDSRSISSRCRTSRTSRGK
jgi:hypothetical protein